MCHTVQVHVCYGLHSTPHTEVLPYSFTAGGALFRCAILSRYMYVMAYTVLLIQRCFHTALLQVVPYSGVPYCPGTCMLWPTQYSSYRGASIQLYCRWCPIQVCHTVQVHVCYGLHSTPHREVLPYSFTAGGALFRCAILSRYMYVMAYTVLLIQRCFHTALLQVVPYSGVPYCPGTCMLWPTQYSSYRGASIQLYCRWCPIQVCHTVQVHVCYGLHSTPHTEVLPYSFTAGGALFRCAILSRYMYVMAYTVLLIERCFHTALLQVVPYSGVPYCPGTCMLWPTQYYSYRGASIQLYCRWCPIQVCHTVQVHVCYGLHSTTHTEVLPYSFTAGGALFRCAMLSRYVTDHHTTKPKVLRYIFIAGVPQVAHMTYMLWSATVGIHASLLLPFKVKGSMINLQDLTSGRYDFWSAVKELCDHKSYFLYTLCRRL